jgi:hypothetical protein
LECKLTEESGDVEKIKSQNHPPSQYRKKPILFDNHNLDVVEGEDPFIFHIVRVMKRQDTRMIFSIRDCKGITHTGTVGILKTFTDFIQTN